MTTPMARLRMDCSDAMPDDFPLRSEHLFYGDARKVVALVDVVFEFLECDSGGDVEDRMRAALAQLTAEGT